LRLLLDTHVLIWALIDPDRLSSSLRSILEDPAQDVLFSAASLWEVAIKSALGRADFKVDPSEILTAAIQTGFGELPVRSAAALKVATLPLHHRDPFDRLLIAQALTEPARLYTADAALEPYSELVVRV
jgi:PIN domain nuclease of toxin-antitoxin system